MKREEHIQNGRNLRQPHWSGSSDLFIRAVDSGDLAWTVKSSPADGKGGAVSFGIEPPRMAAVEYVRDRAGRSPARLRVIPLEAAVVRLLLAGRSPTIRPEGATIMANDSNDLAGKVGVRNDAAPLVGGRLRRRPLAEISGSASRRARDEDWASAPPDEFAAGYQKFLARSPEQVAADEARAREWMETFKATADPQLVDWIEAVGVFYKGDLCPWRTWEDFKASTDPDIREWIDRLSDEEPDTVAPGM